MFTCPRCSGKGIMDAYLHIQNGVCFRCRGTGLVDSLEREDKDESVDEIYSFIKRLIGGVCFVQIYVWNKDTSKKHYGTGHTYGHVIVGTEVSPCHETELHVSLDACREVYRACVAEGYQLIPPDKHREIFDAEVLPHRINCGMQQ